MRLGSGIWIGLAIGLLTACSNDSRRQIRIPAVPKNSAEIRNESALEALTRAINRSAPPSAYAKRAMLHLAAGRTAEALSDINEALDLEDDIGRYHLIKAQILRARRQIDAALESAERAEGLGVKTPELYLVMGDLVQEKKQYDRARLYLTKVLQMSPYEGEAFHFLGLVAARQGDTLTALAQYERTLSLKPRYLESYKQLTAIHAVQGNAEQALEYNRLALQYFPNNPDLIYNRALTFHRAYRLDSAYRYYQDAIRLEPGMYRAHLQLGLISQKWKLFGPALRHFEEVQRLKPDMPRLRFYLATALEQTGQLERALEYYTQESDANPGDYLAKNGVWRVQRRLDYGAYGSLTIPGELGNKAYTTVKPAAPDTGRVRIMTIKPRTRFGMPGDSIK